MVVEPHRVGQLVETVVRRNYQREGEVPHRTPALGALGRILRAGPVAGERILLVVPGVLRNPLDRCRNWWLVVVVGS